MRKLLLFAVLPAMIFAGASCSKKSSSSNVSAAQIQIGQTISTASPLRGAVKGTMKADSVYTIDSTVTINAGDTMLIQKGVTLHCNNNAAIIVNGTFISLGTSTSPVTITDPARTKTTGSSVLGTDSAYQGGWQGIYCGPTCALFVCKWTHLDFAGAGLVSVPWTGSNAPSQGNQYVIYFGNPSGFFILEDSWIYGCPDDIVRFYGGNINVMRNTCEKFGSNGGDGFNAKSGTRGIMAYNMFIGGATNGTKSANDGGVNPECEIAMYNNTYVNCGFRNKGTFGARAGCAEVENNSKALVYNNIIVNCLTGYRIAGGNDVTAKVYHADTTYASGDPIQQTAYGYNLMYGDDTLPNQFVPTNIAQAVITHPQSTDIPNMLAFLGTSYTYGATYNGTSLAGQNNPSFVNYPLPNHNYKTQCSIDGYDFHLATGSPAIGKGNTTFTIPALGIPINDNFGSSGITGPGKDLGCYQTDKTGNQH